LKTPDILFHIAVAQLLIPEEALGTGCDHGHPTDADVVLAAILRMGHIALLGGRTSQRVELCSRWGRWSRQSYRNQLGGEELLESAELTRSYYIAHCYWRPTARRGVFHDDIHISNGFCNPALPIANGLITQLTLGLFEIPRGATSTLMTVQVAIGTDEVQSTISGMRQEIRSIMAARDMLRIVLLHGIDRQTTGHIDGYEDWPWFVWPPHKLGVIHGASLGFYRGYGQITFPTVGVLWQIADPTITIEM